MKKNFLLHNETAIEIFEHICDLPIIDYHCHLDPAAIANNARFRNITELWLGGDHYKWRLMRHNGVPESHVTGNAPDEEKFTAFCSTVEDLIGNPVYHWAHMELRKYFGFEDAITSENAKNIYTHCNKIIARENFDVRNLLEQSCVEWLATTDDPADSLEHHKKIAAAVPLPNSNSCLENSNNVPKNFFAANEKIAAVSSSGCFENSNDIKKNSFATKVFPTFRPGILFDIENPNFPAYLKKLGDVSGIPVKDWDSLRAALSQRMDFFAEMGCKISDHSFDVPQFYSLATDEDADRAIKEAIRGAEFSLPPIAFATRLFSWLGGEYHRRDWVMQLHMGAQRDNNSRMKKIAGADTGFDCIGNLSSTWSLAKIFDDFEQRDALPRTILYGLNPADDDMFAVMTGCFAGRGIRGRIQWGSAWWFNDNKTGIKKHLTTLANHGILANFVGMLTDSRSFLSYSRHEYFRRILAQQLGEWVEAGEFPRDMSRLKKIAADISYYNAKNYF